MKPSTDLDGGSARPSTAPAVWVARLAWAAVLALTAGFIGSGSVAGTAPDLAVYGGLAWCWACDNGWNWHVLCYTVAFPVLMVESLLAFRAPVFFSASR